MMFAALAAALLQAAPSEALPPAIARQLPQGYDVLDSAHSVFGAPVHDVYIVVLNRHGETIRSDGSHPRPLMIYELRSGAWVLIGRNDHVVLQSDEGGQCDPFEGHGLAVKGTWFTVENGVACGMGHWNDFITFRFDAEIGGYIFDNQRNQSWEFNPDERPNAQVLITDGIHVKRAAEGHPVRFEDWRDPEIEEGRAL